MTKILPSFRNIFPKEISFVKINPSLDRFNKTGVNTTTRFNKKIFSKIIIYFCIFLIKLVNRKK